MKIKDLFENWNLTGLKIKASFLEMEWKPSDPDKEAAWDLYVELLTRITTQPLPDEDGVEQTALDSIYALFGITRETLKAHGRSCIQFAKIAIVVLNQVVRPFTAKWHRKSQNGAFASPEECQQFRQELQILQTQLRNYTRLLAELAGVEDLTEIEAENL
ncbi:MAG: hypothetical protein U1D41_11875 [Nitrosomonas sp.]|uniref:hypothetical protein n=3 Tax=Nitrosomonas sp. TaxID=42353 RepID=UPI002731FB41|nr:hypothetical protein [Nitrosomonas sp.]MDP1786017.1 hypothetical protein [Nitrosomonas sp.]MDP3663159.1 hypothetical protein [Nitrosomonas sp.]MDZ4106837.1 hypothetical protein [Nitrosomonas sp.]